MKRVLVAWAPKRESARALADASPFLRSAEIVSVVNTHPKYRDRGEVPASTRAGGYLARHGIDVDVRDLEDAGREPETVLLEEARSFKADLIVMGGYGHSRAQQFVFGGVTRAVIEQAGVPVLMSH